MASDKLSESMIKDRETASALATQHRAELRGLTEREALAAADRLLAMAARTQYPPERERSEGLIERQRILFRIRR